MKEKLNGMMSGFTSLDKYAKTELTKAINEFDNAKTTEEKENAYSKAFDIGIEMILTGHAKR